jgi:hypothetical protein
LTFVGFLVFFITGFATAKGLSILFGSLFNRSELDRFSKMYLKDYKMKDLVADEVLALSLDYNSL